MAEKPGLSMRRRARILQVEEHDVLGAIEFLQRTKRKKLPTKEEWDQMPTAEQLRLCADPAAVSRKCRHWPASAPVLPTTLRANCAGYVRWQDVVSSWTWYTKRVPLGNIPAHVKFVYVYGTCTEKEIDKYCGEAMLIMPECPLRVTGVESEARVVGYQDYKGFPEITYAYGAKVLGVYVHGLCGTLPVHHLTFDRVACTLVQRTVVPGVCSLRLPKRRKF